MFTVNYENGSYIITVNNQPFITFHFYESSFCRETPKLFIHIKTHVLREYDPTMFCNEFSKAFNFPTTDIPFYHIFSSICQIPISKIILNTYIEMSNPIKVDFFECYTYLFFTNDINFVDSNFSNFIVKNILFIEKMYRLSTVNNNYLQNMFQLYDSDPFIQQHVKSFFNSLENNKFDIITSHKYLAPTFLVKYLEAMLSEYSFLIYPLIISILCHTPFSKNVFYNLTQFLFPVSFSHQTIEPNDFVSYFVPLSFVDFIFPKLCLSYKLNETSNLFFHHFDFFKEFCLSINRYL